MMQCIECGAKVSPEEQFCGNCGVHQPPASNELKTVAATFVPEPNSIVEGDNPEPAAVAEDPHEARTSEPPKIEDSQPISSASLGGVSTDDVQVLGTNAATHKGTTGGHKPGVKQLETGTVLNGRYEIVRRIG